MHYLDYFFYKQLRWQQKVGWRVGVEVNAAGAVIMVFLLAVSGIVMLLGILFGVWVPSRALNGGVLLGLVVLWWACVLAYFSEKRTRLIVARYENEDDRQRRRGNAWVAAWTVFAILLPFVALVLMAFDPSGAIPEMLSALLSHK